MGVGSPSCTAACCLPDALTFAGKSQEEVLGAHRHSITNGTMNLSVGIPDELDGRENKSNMIIFRNDRAPAEMCGTPRSARERFSNGVDSCTMLNDLDFLATPEWQTMPHPTPSALENNLLVEAESASPDAAYSVALRALWHNAPDALEVALRRAEGSPMTDAQARDKRFMEQKLEFTRIRQRFVVRCIDFRTSGTSEASSITLRAGVAEIEERIEKLMVAQPDEQMTQLPGLIGKRDTLMLQARIRTITGQLLAGGADA